ncbi:MAG TPA: FlgD immunoglobulin-like domain containing protein, partial [Candidatus Krumholzibacteria bacterium]|nr:FlgD immunoglobulin-like domain containing protein [Candidatus Krumholzibacteria bacterium]
GHSNTGVHMATYCSFDKGQTWTLVPVGDAQDHLGLTPRFDPAVTFDANGNVFVAYGTLVFTGSTERTSLVVAKNTDGGQTYGPAFIIGTANRVLNVPGHDKWVLATGPDPTVPGRENIYIAWTWNIPTPAGNVDQQISISRSIDGGQTFSPPLVINDDSIAGRDRALVADPSVGPNGEVYVSWNDIDATDATLFVDRSFDGGLTWGTDVVVSTGAMAWRTPIPAQPDRGVGAAPVMDVDISGGAFTGRAYIVYCQPGANGLDILLRYSDDQAQTWSLPVRVNDDATMRDQFLPWIDVGRTNGLVSVVFYDAREDPLNQSVRVYAAMSRTGGVTFEPNEPVADVPSNQSVANPNRYGGNYLEYIGVATGDDAVHIVWTDARFLWPVLIDYSLRFYYDGIPLESPPVPVLFSAFDAVAIEEGVRISWELWSDEAIDEFVLYRHEDASLAIAVARGAIDGATGWYVDSSVDPGKTYAYDMVVRTTDGDEFRSRVATVTTPGVTLALGQNHPNPFNPRTTIPYQGPAAARPERVRLVVLDVSGRVVRTLVDEDQSSGAFRVNWDGKDDRGARVSSGVYFYLLEVGEKRRARKMVLLK